MRPKRRRGVALLSRPFAVAIVALAVACSGARAQEVAAPAVSMLNSSDFLDAIRFRTSCQGATKSTVEGCGNPGYAVARLHAPAEAGGTAFRRKLGAEFSDLDLGAIIAAARKEAQGSADGGELCAELLDTFSCLSFMRHCPYSYDGSSSVAPCRKACELTERHCKIGQGIFAECHLLPDGQCSLETPDGYFLLNEEQGPFSPLLPLFFDVMAGLWGVGFLAWIALCFCWPGLGVPSISRAATIIPFTKAPVVVLHALFWTRCAQNGMCNFWLSITILNAQLIHETLTMTILLMAATGYCVTSTRLSQDDWRSVILNMTVFYCGSSVFLILWRGVLSSLGLILYIAVLYGLPLQQLLRSAWRTMRKANFVFSLVPTDALPRLRRPVAERAYMFRIFVGLAVLYIFALLGEHLALYHSADIAVPLIIGEVAFFVIVFSLGYLYRPRKFSPYFFLTTVRGGPDGDEDGEDRIPPIFEAVGLTQAEEPEEPHSPVERNPLLTSAEEPEEEAKSAASPGRRRRSPGHWLALGLGMGPKDVGKSRAGRGPADRRSATELELTGVDAERRAGEAARGDEPASDVVLSLPRTAEGVYNETLAQAALVVENPDGSVEVLVRQDRPSPEQIEEATTTRRRRRRRRDRSRNRRTQPRADAPASERDGGEAREVRVVHVQ